MSEHQTGDRWGWLRPVMLMLAGVLVWLWPIGLGGQIPVGGDATQFSIGLMGFLRGSLQAGRLPLWNDLWGFGFPGLAESQMGVFYPPHILLYGLLPTETAYTASLVLHTLWGALGARWAARRFGVSEAGAALSGFSWATCGFFLIHLPHQWGYTVGSWMPWAWGLTWLVARGEGSRRTVLFLSAVLAVQVLPGHFQLAFITEVSVLVLALASGRSRFRGSFLVMMAILGMLPLAAMQLWPTFQLAQLSNSHRDFEYLSGFAATPIHLISYVAPNLFHRSPLWRPVAWDPFHTSPEEMLGSVGLIPLFLALGAIRHGSREDASIRALRAVGFLMMLLSLGPYLPGFRGLIGFPGFSFFRAPARWGLALALTLAILAGKGFDSWRSWPRPGRSAWRFAIVAGVAILVVIAGFEVALASLRLKGWPLVASGYDRVMSFLPWADDPGTKSFRAVMAEAYQPRNDLRTRTALARLDGKPPKAPGPSLAGERLAIYRQELTGSAGLLAAILVASVLTRRKRAFAVVLIALTAADLLLLSRHRPFDLGPARSLIEQSPVLARLAREPRGLRTLDPSQNLFLLAGKASVASYRTLDLPSPFPLLMMARGPADDPRVSGAIRAAGVGIRVLDPIEFLGGSPEALPVWAPGAETIRDPALAGWLFGTDLASSTGLADFTLLRPRQEPSRAWLMSANGLERTDGMADPFAILDRFGSASPLPWKSDVPERAEVEVRLASAVPSMVVLSQTFDPEWGAFWSGPSGKQKAEVVKVFGGWLGVAVPGPGRWSLFLEYPGRAAWLGLAISSVAWSIWVGFVLRLRFPRPAEPENRESG